MKSCASPSLELDVEDVIHTVLGPALSKKRDRLVMHDDSCPVGTKERRIDERELSPTLRRYVEETGTLPIKECHMSSKMGMVKFTPTKFDGVGFGVGFVAIPSVVNFVSRLNERGMLFGWSPLATRGVAGALTLGAHLFTGGSSFGLGSFLGQVPGLLDELAGAAIDAMSPVAPGAPSKEEMKGVRMGQADDLARLREEIARAQVSGNLGQGSRHGAFESAEVAGVELGDRHGTVFHYAR